MAKAYRNYDTRDLVWEEDWQDYAMEQLGVNIEPQGIGGIYTLEQKDFIETLIDWYFSDNWKLVDLNPNYEDQSNYEDVIEDKIYQNNLEKRLLNE